MSLKPLSLRSEPCLCCRRRVDFYTLGSTDPEAPELIVPAALELPLAERPWIGIGGPFENGSMRLLVLCSETCAHLFLEAGE